MSLTTRGWNPYFTRNMLHLCMHTIHGIYMLIMLTHDSMYARVYTCTHCGCKGHLAKFYYDKLNAFNFTSQNVWIRRGTNPYGSKKVWVSKFIPISFDVGVVSHKTWEIWCLGGECVWLKWIQHWMHRYPKSFGGRSTKFLKIWRLVHSIW